MNKRNLTTDEIDRIIGLLPPFQAATKNARDYGTKERNNHVRAELEFVKIEDSKVEKFTKACVNSYYIAGIQAGEAVGILSAEAITQPLTQETLSSYHKVGISDNNSSNMKRTSEIFQAREERAEERLDLHFNDDNLFAHELDNIMYRIKGLKINDLMHVSNSTAEKKGLITYNPKKKIPWLKEWCNITGNSVKYYDTNIFYRVEFNVSQLFRHNISLDEICETILNYGTVRCVPSPTSLGIIDIFIDMDEFTLIDNEDSAEIEIAGFFDGVVSKSFDTYVRHYEISNISHFDIKEIRVLTIMDPREVFVEMEGDKAVYDVYGNAFECAILGITDSKFSKLFQACGVQVIDKKVGKHELYYRLLSPDNTSPITYIRREINNAEEKFDIHRELTSTEEIYDLNYDDPVWRAASYCYAVARSASFDEALIHEEINPTVTILHNPVKVYKSMGIEACRNMYVREICEIIGAITPVHAELIANILCIIGVPVPATSKGASKQGRETFADAAFEKPMEYIIKSALHGTKETTESTSTCIFLGKRCKIGTGASKIEIDKNWKYEKFEDEANSINIDPDIFDGQIIELNNLDNREPDVIDPGDNEFDNDNEDIFQWNINEEDSSAIPRAPGESMIGGGESRAELSSIGGVPTTIKDINFDDFEL